jgi:hypothetical protein
MPQSAARALTRIPRTPRAVMPQEGLHPAGPHLRGRAGFSALSGTQGRPLRRVPAGGVILHVDLGRGSPALSGTVRGKKTRARLEQLRPSALRSCQGLFQLRPLALRSCQGLFQLRPLALRSCQGLFKLRPLALHPRRRYWASEWPGAGSRGAACDFSGRSLKRAIGPAEGQCACGSRHRASQRRRPGVRSCVRGFRGGRAGDALVVVVRHRRGRAKWKWQIGSAGRGRSGAFLWAALTPTGLLSGSPKADCERGAKVPS